MKDNIDKMNLYLIQILNDLWKINEYTIKKSFDLLQTSNDLMKGIIYPTKINEYTRKISFNLMQILKNSMKTIVYLEKIRVVSSKYTV